MLIKLSKEDLDFMINAFFHKAILPDTKEKFTKQLIDLQEKARRYEENEKNIALSNAIINQIRELVGSSKIPLAKNETLVQNIGELIIKSNIQSSLLEKITSVINGSELCFDRTRDIMYKILEIIDKAKHDQVNKDLSTKSGMLEFFMHCLDEFYKKGNTKIDADDIDQLHFIIKEKLNA